MGANISMIQIHILWNGLARFLVVTPLVTLLLTNSFTRLRDEKSRPSLPGGP